MKGIILLVVALLLSAVTASATATVQKWTAGWDNFGEPLNYTEKQDQLVGECDDAQIVGDLYLGGRDAQQA